MKKEESKYPYDQFNGVDKNGNLDMSLSINKTLDKFMEDLEKGVYLEKK